MRSFVAVIVIFATLPAIAAHAADREVTADEAIVRSAPFDVAPEIARVRAGDRLPADDQPQGVWRRVQLQEGRFGFMRDADLQEPPPASAAAPASQSDSAQPEATPATAPATTPTPVARVRAPAPVDNKPQAGPSLFGVVFEILPVGTLRATDSGTMATNASIDSAFAVAVATALDFPASPYFAVGISPKVIFRVKADGSEGLQSSTQYDFRLRLTGRAPLSRTTRVYARVSPGYSMISVPAPAPNQVVALGDPKGFLVDTSVGVEVALLPNLFVIADLGYQVGFQSTQAANSSRTFDGSQYLHLGGGFAVGF